MSDARKGLHNLLKRDAENAKRATERSKKKNDRLLLS